MPKKLLYYQLSTLLTISLIWVVFGIVFYENLVRPGNDLGVIVTLFQFCFAFGLIGFIISAIHIFYLKPAFNHQPSGYAAILKLLITVFLFVFITFILSAIYFVFMYHGDFERFTKSFFTKIVQTRTFNIFLLDMGLMTLLSITILEVTDKYGPGMFWSMLSGKYHKPKIENKIFIFLDINESTTIAEKLGHVEYFFMLRRFFRDLTIPVLANDGEIYQYVGDEIVVCWPNTPENKLKSLKFIRNTFYLIERLSKTYKKRFGKIPRFKAGVHAGEVTAGFVGVLKRELIYCGDTMNTAARIRSMCNELNESFIISEDFMVDFNQPFGYEIKEIGQMDIRGKKDPIKLFSLNFE